jgi:hypothetical protein
MAVQYLTPLISRAKATVRKRWLPQVAQGVIYAGLAAAAIVAGFLLGVTIALLWPVSLSIIVLTGMAAVFALASALLEQPDALPEPGGE